MSEKPRPRWFRRIVKICLSLLFGIVTLEIALTVSGWFLSRPASPVRDLERLPIEKLIDLAAEQNWIAQPNSTNVVDTHGEHRLSRIPLKTNWCGLREDDDTKTEKAAGVSRILVVGDSHTEGIVLNQESFANVLEAQLGSRYEVLNAGKGMTSPYQQFWSYKHVYSRFHPDFLIIGFYAGNDLLDLMLQQDRIHLQWDGEHYVHAEPTSLAGVHMTLDGTPKWERVLLKFATFRAMVHVGWQLSEPRRFRTRSKGSGEYFDRLESAGNLYPAPTWQGLNQSYFFKRYPEEWTEAVKMLRNVLLRFKTTASEAGIDLALIVIPTFRQIDTDVVIEAAKLLRLNEHDLNTDERLCDLTVKMCGELDIPVIDMREAMKQSEEKLFWSFDHHINVAAHRLIAETLGEYFTDHLSRAK